MSAAISCQKRTIVIVVLISSLTVIIPILYLIHNSATALAEPSITKDLNLKVETVVAGLSSPTSMAFIDNDNILVLEKGGQVRLVSNGVLVASPVLQVPVATESERDLLGIAIMNSSSTTTKSGNSATDLLHRLANNEGLIPISLPNLKKHGPDLYNLIISW
jgi:hypothetical protein